MFYLSVSVSSLALYAKQQILTSSTVVCSSITHAYCLLMTIPQKFKSPDGKPPGD